MNSAASVDVFDAAAARFKLTGVFRPYLLLTALCLCLFAPGLATLPPTDRDESRFMQATRQMIETGNFIDIRFQAEPRNKKPVGIYWLQAAAVTAGGDTAAPWLYRLPSAIAAWIAVLMTYALGRRLFAPVTGLMAAGMLATSLLLVSEAHLAKTDAALLASVTLCFAALGRIYARQERGIGAALQFWLSLAAGILIKGPVIVAVVGPCLAALCIADRDMKWLARLRPFMGVPLLLAVTAPWFLLQQSEGAGGFVMDSWRSDILPKLIGGQETHGAPPGAHLLLSFITAWPWSVLAPFALIAAWRARNEPAVRFCLAWLAPAWLLFELVPTKLPHYTLPLMPPLMLLCARFLRGGAVELAAGWGFAWRIIWAWGSIALGVTALVMARRFGDGDPAPAVILAGVTLAVALFAMARLGRASPLHGGLALGAAGALFAFTAFGFGLPHLSRLAIADRIAAAAKPRLTPDVPLVLAGYHEPSAVFRMGTGTILTTPKNAVERLVENPAVVAVMPVADLDLLRAAAAQTGRALEQIAAIDGYNYARGQREALVLVTLQAPQ